MSTTAEQLDLTRLPPFSLVVSDFDAEYTALKIGIAARLTAAGVPFELGSIETDSSSFLAREFAYQKTLTLDALNEAGLNLTLSYTSGPALDHIAATYYADLNLRRLVLRPANPATGEAVLMESDERFKARLLRAGEARTHGTLGGYEFEALTAAPFLDGALALNHASGLVRPGQILMILLGRNPDPNPLTARPAEEEPAQIALARAALLDRTIKLGTDEVLVRAARRVRVSRAYALGIRPGPDPSLVTAEARRRFDAYAIEVRQVGRLLAESGEKAALFASGVQYAHPAAGQSGDVDPGIDGVIEVMGLTLTTESPGG